jgi:alkaline phosphatase
MPAPLVSLLFGLAAAAAPAEDPVELYRQHGRDHVAAALAATPDTRRPPGVILIIGDGMGVSTVTAARIYAGQLQGRDGETHRLAWEDFPHVALAATYNLDAQVPDSAGTSSALHTGAKVPVGTLSVDSRVVYGDCASQLRHGGLPTLHTIAEDNGLATGIVTTTRVTHATPAATYAVSADRDWEHAGADPAMGDCPDIAAQLLASPHGDGPEVVYGGGRANFLPVEQGGRRTDGRDLLAEWSKRGRRWKVVEQPVAEPRKKTHLLGLFADSHLPWEGEGTVTLADMTVAALARLSQDPDGFVLTVEGGRIDHAHHYGKARRALDETVALDAAVRAAREHAPPGTLILVTADHSHVFTMGGYARRNQPILGLNTTVEDGEIVPKLDKHGKAMTTLGYNNGPAFEWLEDRPDPAEADTTAHDHQVLAGAWMGSETHGGEDVAVYALGPWSHLVRGTMEQSDLFHVIVHALQLEEPGAEVRRGVEATQTQ